MKLFKSYITSLTIIILIGLTFVNFVQAFQGETLEGYFQGKLPSVQERIPLAIECGIVQYVGSKEQNNTLLECIKKGDKEIEKILIPQIINEEGDAILGAGYTPVTGYQSRTTQYISSAATTIPVVSTLDKAGNQIDLSSISPSSTVKVYMNLAPGTSKEEPIVCTGLTATSWTGCTRGLSFQGSSESSSSTLAQNHNAGTPIIITNIGQSFNQFVSVEGAQNIYGVKTFYLYPEVPSTLGFPTTTYQLVTKQYVDVVALQGAATSTESVAGISELATQVEMASTTDFGVTRPLVLQAKYATSTCQITGLYVPITQNDGKISSVCLDLTESYSWTGTHSWTATTTFTTSTFTSSTITLLNITTTSISQGLVFKGVTANKLFQGETANADALHSHPYVVGTQLADDWFSFSVVPTSTSGGWTRSQIGVTGGGIRTLLTADGSNTQQHIFGQLPGTGANGTLQFNDGKGIRMKFRAKETGVTIKGIGFMADGTEFDAVATSSLSGIRFVFIQNQVYAYTANGAGTYANISSGLTTTNWNTYEIVWDGASSVQFYINGVLKTTHTTTTPSAVASEIQTGASVWVSGTFDFSPLTYSIQN